MTGQDGTVSAAELLRHRAAEDPEGHRASLGRGYGVGPHTHGGTDAPECRTCTGRDLSGTELQGRIDAAISELCAEQPADFRAHAALNILNGTADQSLPLAPRDGLAGSDEAVKAEPTRQQIVRYLAEQFPRSTRLDHEFGADCLLAIFAEHAARVRAEAVAEERQRLADAILPDHWQTTETWGGVRRLVCGRCRHGDGVRFLWPCRTRRAITGEPEPEPDSTLLAAGSVPAATPPVVEARLMSLEQPSPEEAEERGIDGLLATFDVPAGLKWGDNRCKIILPGPVATPAAPAERHVCSGTPCPTQHHAFYGQLCNVPSCREDFCIGSQEPSVGTGTPAEATPGGSEHAERQEPAGPAVAASTVQALLERAWAMSLTAEVARLTGALAVSEAERVEVFTEAASCRAAIEGAISGVLHTIDFETERPKTLVTIETLDGIGWSQQPYWIIPAAALGDGAEQPSNRQAGWMGPPDEFAQTGDGA